MHVKWKVEHYRDGKKIAEYNGRNSFVQGGSGWLAAALGHQTSAGLATDDEGGTSRNPFATFFTNAGARRYHTAFQNSVSYGIHVGTDDTAVDPTDYALGSHIDNGTGGGELSYGTLTISALTADGTDGYYFNCSRPFTNNSGGTITVKEIGLVGGMNDGTGGRIFYMLRDVITPIELLNGDATTITYQFYFAKDQGWTKQMGAIFREYGTASGTTNGKDTGGTIRAMQMWCQTNDYVSLQYYVPCAGGSNRGIQVGSGDTAMTIDDYALDTLIANGTGAGQLSYGAQSERSSIAVNSDEQKVVGITRAFTNNSGGDVTIKEVGFVAGWYYASGTNGYFLLWRKVLDTPVTLSPGETYTVYWQPIVNA